MSQAVFPSGFQQLVILIIDELINSSKLNPFIIGFCKKGLNYQFPINRSNMFTQIPYIVIISRSRIGTLNQGSDFFGKDFVNVVNRNVIRVFSKTVAIWVMLYLKYAPLTGLAANTMCYSVRRYSCRKGQKDCMSGLLSYKQIR